MPTYRLVVEYDGSAFAGLQYQPDLRTVAGVLEAALSRIFHAPVKIAAAGRTDAGVHAVGQVVSFSADRPFPLDRLVLAINGNLADDVVVRDAVQVRDGFSARFDARERTYQYLVHNRGFGSALWRRRAWFVPRPIDDARFVAAGQPLLGAHDFASYCAEPPAYGGTVRDLRGLGVARHGDLLRVTLRGDGFLHRMVRLIVGTLVECATGYREVAFAGEALEARRRGAAGTTAPAHGLYLAGVRYDDFDSFRAVEIAP
ncbi:MAG TPA: tRNA pseudouridine(38-40) synthase TruA [Candidatus Elarobacter sp.]|nr:tRNA pseudouridine(38-40) synthase TruA [Candidatus Elarobacter sp.]